MLVAKKISKNKIIAYFIIIGIMFGGMFFLLQSSRPTLPSPDKIILYFGNTCPHCKDLEKYILDNKIKEKVSFEEKEVYENKTNSTELTMVATSCNIPNDQIFVPFMYANGKCLVGGDEITKFLNDKAGLPN